MQSRPVQNDIWSLLIRTSKPRQTEWQRLGDGFAGLGGDSVYQEAPEVISRGPAPPPHVYNSFSFRKRNIVSPNCSQFVLTSFKN